MRTGALRQSVSLEDVLKSEFTNNTVGRPEKNRWTGGGAESNASIATSGGVRGFKTAIECGYKESDSADDAERIFIARSPFFHTDVQVFVAESDQLRRLLVKASDVSRLMNVAPSRLAMYLNRRKGIPGSGIFQAAKILHRHRSCPDVKTGGYFLAIQACTQLRKYLQVREALSSGPSDSSGSEEPTSDQFKLAVGTTSSLSKYSSRSHK